jgi:hypothetical protein
MFLLKILIVEILSFSILVYMIMPALATELGHVFLSAEGAKRQLARAGIGSGS